MPHPHPSTRWITATLRSPAFADTEGDAIKLAGTLPADSSHIAVIIDADASTTFAPEFTYALFRELFRRRAAPTVTILRPPPRGAPYLASAAQEFGVESRVAVVPR